MAGQIVPPKIWLAGLSHFKSVLNKRPEIEKSQELILFVRAVYSAVYFFLYLSVSLKMLSVWTPGLSLKLPRIAIFRAFNLRAEKTDYCKKIHLSFLLTIVSYSALHWLFFLVTFFVSYNVSMSAKWKRGLHQVEGLCFSNLQNSKHGAPLNSFLIIKTFLRSRVSNFVFSIKLKFSWKE